MTDYFYFDQNGQKQGPVNRDRLKLLTLQGAVESHAPIETVDGRKGVAGEISGLFPSVSPSPRPAQPTPQQSATDNRCYTADEVEFMNAVAKFKQTSGQTFPTCSEILEILRSLGYQKVVP